MTRLERNIQELKERGEEFKQTRMLVPTIKKEIDFVLIIYNGEIDEYLWFVDSQDEDGEIEFWVQESGGASLLAKSIGMEDTQWTF